MQASTLRAWANRARALANMPTANLACIRTVGVVANFAKQSVFPARGLGVKSVKRVVSVQRRSFVTMAAAASEIEVFGKAATGTGSPSKERGDCPFSQRIYMVLEEKHIPYTATYIQEGNEKPDWFMKNNPSGLMPALRDGSSWIQDSDKIFEYLENKFPEPCLKTPEQFQNVGAGIFPAFTNWLKSKNPNDPGKEQYLKELSALNDHLSQHGPYIAGDRPTDKDFALAPKLRHARVALKHFMNFEIPNNLSALKKYIQLMESRPSFKKTDSPDEMIIAGWQKKFSLPDKIAVAN